MRHATYYILAFALGGLLQGLIDKHQAMQFADLTEAQKDMVLGEAEQGRSCIFGEYGEEPYAICSDNARTPVSQMYVDALAQFHDKSRQELSADICGLLE